MSCSDVVLGMVFKRNKKGNKNSSCERNVETNGRKMAARNKKLPWGLKYRETLLSLINKNRR